MRNKMGTSLRSWDVRTGERQRERERRYYVMKKKKKENENTMLSSNRGQLLTEHIKVLVYLRQESSFFIQGVFKQM